MDTLQSFLAYAADFEKTFEDDDWSRLMGYFADDAVYRVESEIMGCELVGPEAILGGMNLGLESQYRALALEVKSRRKTMGTPTSGGELRRRIISVTTVKKSAPIPIPLTKEVVASASSCSSVCSADTLSPILDVVTGLDWTREVRKVRHTLGVCCHRHRKRSV